MRKDLVLGAVLLFATAITILGFRLEVTTNFSPRVQFREITVAPSNNLQETTVATTPVAPPASTPQYHQSNAINNVRKPQTRMTQTRMTHHTVPKFSAAMGQKVEDIEGVSCKLGEASQLPEVLRANLEKPTVLCPGNSRKGHWLHSPLHHGVFSTLDNDSIVLLEAQNDSDPLSGCAGLTYAHFNDGGLTSEPFRIRRARTVIPSSFAQTEQVVVECRVSEKQSTFDLYMRPIKNELAERRAKKLSSIRRERVKLDEEQLGGFDNVKVLFYVIDSLSRGSAVRLLKKSIAFLQKLNNNSASGYTVFDFHRFNVVGVGTFSNLPPLLHGLTSKEMVTDSKKKYVYPESQNDLRSIGLWELFHQYGAVSAFVEETCWKETGSMGRIWNGKQSGDLSEKKAALSLMDTMKAADHSVATIICDLLLLSRVNSYFDAESANGRCFGGRYLHQYTMRYMTEFFDMYPGVPQFGFVKNTDAHESRATRVRSADDDLRSFLEYLTSRHDNLFLILMGDHGIGYGPFFETVQGSTEYNLPALFLVISDRLLDVLEKTIPDIRNLLDVNSRRLTTSHDLYATVLHVLHVLATMNSNGPPTGSDPEEQAHADRKLHAATNKNLADVMAKLAEKGKQIKKEAETNKKKDEDSSGSELGSSTNDEEEPRKKVKEAPQQTRGFFPELNAYATYKGVGRSLFNELPANRSCKEAGVPLKYCSCTTRRTVDYGPDLDYSFFLDNAGKGRLMKVGSKSQDQITFERYFHYSLAVRAVSEINKEARATKKGPCFPLELLRVKRSEVSSVEKCENVVIIFTTTVETTSGTVYEETFEAHFILNTSRIATIDYRVQEVQVGESFDVEERTFLGPLLTLPPSATNVWMVETLDTVDKGSDLTITWVGPNSKPFSVVNVSWDHNWRTAWQRLDLSQYKENSGTAPYGLWKVYITPQDSDQVWASVPFVVLSPKFPGMEPDILDDFWEIESIKRLSAYGPFKECADPKVPLPYCICDRG